MVRSVREQVRLYIDQNLSQTARAQQIADFAQDAVAKMIAEKRASPAYRRFVDGVEGAQPNTIRPGGSILYAFSYIAEAALFAIGFLQARSPASGPWPKDPRYPKAYRDCFVIAVDGRPIPAAQFQPRSVPLNAEIIIFNSQPYSRKVDVQMIGKRPIKFSVPPGIFDDAARAVNRRFGNTAKATRRYSVDFPGKHITRKGRAVDSPALILTPLE